MTQGIPDCNSDRMDCAKQAIRDIAYYKGLELRTCKALGNKHFSAEHLNISTM